MPADVSEQIQRAGPGSRREPELSSQKHSCLHESFNSQIPSEGFDVVGNARIQQWSDAELQEVFEAVLAGEAGALETEEEQKPEEVAKRRICAITDEKHIPGVNDIMSGALPQRGARENGGHAVEEFDDPTVSIDTLPHLYRSMPHYMVSVQLLKTLSLFGNTLIYDVLPDGFFTTVKGLKCAWDEANAEQPDASVDMDEYLLHAVLKRGGVVKNAYWSVKYPCDIVPLDGGNGDLEFWREIRGMAWTGDESEQKT